MRHLMICAAAGLATLTAPRLAPAQAPTAHGTAPVPANAEVTKESRPSGFMLGVHSIGIPGLAISGAEAQDDVINTAFGGGGGVTLGWEFNGTFAAFTRLDLAKQKTAGSNVPNGSWGLAHLELGARANLPLGGAATIPYVTASFGGRALASTAMLENGETTDVSLSGHYFGFGAGIEHAFSRSMAIDGGVDLDFGRFSHMKLGGEEADGDVNPTKSIRLRLGVTWRPGAHRTT
ncbi:MAG TPA: outer membrane beta-barrel protein [Gemmatimonadaceae bacterium]|nr:outer membrane beta-barrel protein [Gemmatimonadaceae bacterium]